MCSCVVAVIMFIDVQTTVDLLNRIGAPFAIVSFLGFTENISNKRNRYIG